MGSLYPFLVFSGVKRNRCEYHKKVYVLAMVQIYQITLTQFTYLDFAVDTPRKFLEDATKIINKGASPYP